VKLLELVEKLEETEDLSSLRDVVFHRLHLDNGAHLLGLDQLAVDVRALHARYVEVTNVLDELAELVSTLGRV